MPSLPVHSSPCARVSAFCAPRSSKNVLPSWTNVPFSKVMVMVEYFFIPSSACALMVRVLLLHRAKSSMKCVEYLFFVTIAPFSSLSK